MIARDAIGAPRDVLGALVAIGGGALIVVGALLPWMSLFAGLHRYSGIDGLYGRLALAGGALALATGLMALLHPRPRRSLRSSVGVLGVALTVFASWILIGLRSTTHALGRHPLLLARPGPGPVVVFAGALVLALLLVRFRRET